jgi:hypothetical protein
MQIFLSWSGDSSEKIANALKGFLRDVFPTLGVWISEHDIQAGSRWGSELTSELEKSHFGIVCLTPENLASLWIAFEAGALSKAINKSRVVPYLFQLKAADLAPPLSQFLAVSADAIGTLRLVRSINDVFEKFWPTDADLTRHFKQWWPQLEESLSAIQKRKPREMRADREILEEILETVRSSGMRALQTSLGQVLALPNVKSIEIAKKQVAGQDTETLSFQIIVFKKQPLALLPPDQRIPSSICGMPTDVIEGQSPPLPLADARVRTRARR